MQHFLFICQKINIKLFFSPKHKREHLYRPLYISFTKGLLSPSKVISYKLVLAIGGIGFCLVNIDFYLVQLSSVSWSPTLLTPSPKLSVLTNLCCVAYWKPHSCHCKVLAEYPVERLYIILPIQKTLQWWPPRSSMSMRNPRTFKTPKCMLSLKILWPIHTLITVRLGLKNVSILIVMIPI